MQKKNVGKFIKIQMKTGFLEEKNGKNGEEI